MKAATVPVQQATIRQYAKRLQLATIAGQFVAVAEQAIKEKQSHLNYLEVLLGMEVEERERNTVARRIKDAHFPKVKTLEEFAFSDAPHIPVALVRNLSEGGYLQRSEPIIFLGETGTGKTQVLAAQTSSRDKLNRKRSSPPTPTQPLAPVLDA
jgi:DNA replication protein DnaC